jgi:hypothetical protein
MHTIKVYADFIQKKGIDYRKKTLLQINGGTKLIGSAVLINPGSAAPLKEPCDGKFIKDFFKLNHAEESIDINTWKKFSVDPTMKQLVKLFDGTYATGSPTKIEGVIQLFNCFYLMEKDLTKALERYKQQMSNNPPEDPQKITFQEDKYFKDMPVYFGWGKTGKTENKIKDTAQNIFKNYQQKQTSIYNISFEDNPFYHPRYVNIAYTRNDAVKKVAVGFFKAVKKAGSVSK